MPDEVWKGGLGAAIFGIAAYFLLPMLKSFSDASASRSGVDFTLHDLYQKMLVEQTKLTEENAKSRAAVSRLTEAVESLQSQLAASKEREEKLSNEVNSLRRELSALTDALATARGDRRAANQT